MSAITSRDNPRVRRWRELAQDGRARRKEGRVLIEGEHLVETFLASGGRVEQVIVAASAKDRVVALAKRGGKMPVELSDAVFKSVSDVESTTGIAAEIPLPENIVDLGGAPNCLFLEGIQDAGNVGAILRSAAAFGLRHAVLGTGCADPWSPKVLRAGMGAHFSMLLQDGAELGAAIERFAGRLCCTVPRGGIPLAQADLSGRTGWLFGAEGQGVSETLLARASVKVSIPMPGAAESLNVAAAAAICFYELSRSGA